MAKISVTQLICKRCGKTWIPRQTDVVMCPKCKSPRWNQPRRVACETDNEDSGHGQRNNHGGRDYGVGYS